MTGVLRRVDAPARGSAWEVFLVFLRLGTTSFGGPIAHLGYFRAELVERRRWLDDREYADLVALCQFLPGPASSQVGFAIGLHRAGWRGALAAFVAFTFPSAALMVGFAFGAAVFAGPVAAGLLAGLKIVAVAIVAHAVLGMVKTLAPDRCRASILGLAAIAALLVPGVGGQTAAILLGAVAGLLFCRGPGAEPGGVLSFPVRRRVGVVSLLLFGALLAGGPVLAHVTGSGSAALFEVFYRAGSLVFGGGHVVLPLLQAGVVESGWVSGPDFLSGYGAAQALPGPLFALAAFLGVISSVGPGGAPGALIALVAIFLPGFLLLLGTLPFWNVLRQRAGVEAAMRGVNAAVVGILVAALYMPVFSTAITGAGPFCLGLLCFILLVSWKLPPWIVVIVGAAGGIALALLSPIS